MHARRRGKDDEEGEDYWFVGRNGLRKKLLNKRQRKKNTLQDEYERLKPIIPYPELFELEDAASLYPVLHNQMKGRSGSVPVPKCWKSNSGRIFPKEYEKPKYVIPANILSTGIPELREILREKEAEMSLREKIKERLYPRLGKSLICQKTLYEAFSFTQKKPYMTKYGEVVDCSLQCLSKRYSPGTMSIELMNALGIDEKTPPPWLFNMQKHGMPPSYPKASIPGMTSQIPDGCLYGYQPKGWGTPPVDLHITFSSTIKDEIPVEVVRNEENQYTTPIYVGEFERKVKTLTCEARGRKYVDEGDGMEAYSPSKHKNTNTPGHKEGSRNEATKEEKKERKERLYKNIRF